MAEAKNEAVAALDAFADSYAPKYAKAVECLTKDALAEHESDREHVRHGATPHGPIEGLPLEQDRDRHGVQAH